MTEVPEHRKKQVEAAALIWGDRIQVADRVRGPMEIRDRPGSDQMDLMRQALVQEVTQAGDLRALLGRLLDDWHGGYVGCGENLLTVDKQIEITDAEQAFCLELMQAARERNNP